MRSSIATLAARETRAGRVVRFAITYFAWPLLTTAFVVLYVQLAKIDNAERYMQSSASLTALSVGYLLLWILLERIQPYRAEWNVFGRQGCNDLLHYGLGIAAPEELVRIGLYALLPLVAIGFPKLGAPWPES